MSKNDIINVLTKASEYRRNQLKDKSDKWITVGMISDSHTMLKTMANFYGLSLAETLRIIIKSAFKEFTDFGSHTINYESHLDKKGDKNGNS